MFRTPPPTPRGPAAPPRAEPAEEPRWLTFRCVRCGGRFYGGITTSALARKLGEDPLVKPDFFHADCGVETPLERAELQLPDGTPWTPGP